MNRNFITYHQPSLSSGITDVQHKPQMVEVKEQRADGWLKIVTSKGEKWTPLTEKQKRFMKDLLLMKKLHIVLKC